MALTSSMEDYLEAVFMLQKRKGYARCTDVAEHLGVKKPSVSRAVKELSKMGYLLKEADGTLSLTEQGRQIAEQVYEKHQFFTHQLIEAGVPPDIAARDACKLEHCLLYTSDAAHILSVTDSVLDRLEELERTDFIDKDGREIIPERFDVDVYKRQGPGRHFPAP